jgi:hypothetical protein
MGWRDKYRRGKKSEDQPAAPRSRMRWIGGQISDSRIGVRVGKGASVDLEFNKTKIMRNRDGNIVFDGDQEKSADEKNKYP